MPPSASNIKLWESYHLVSIMDHKTIKHSMKEIKIKTVKIEVMHFRGKIESYQIR